MYIPYLPVTTKFITVGYTVCISQLTDLLCVVSVSCFGVRVSVMFHFMFVHYTLSSVWVAEWQTFGK